MTEITNYMVQVIKTDDYSEVRVVQEVASHPDGNDYRLLSIGVGDDTDTNLKLVVAEAFDIPVDEHSLFEV